MRFVQKSRSTVGLIKWTVVQSGWECQYPTHWSSLLDKPLHNTAMMSSHHNMHRLSPRTQVQLSSVRHRWTHARARTHAPTCSRACDACAHKHTDTHTFTFLQIHTQTHPVPYTQTHQQCVLNLWQCCLWAPLFSGKGLTFHKHPTVCLYKLPGCAEYTWALMSESTLCQPVCPSNSVQVVDKSG